MSETEIQALQLAVKAILNQLGPASAAVAELNKKGDELQSDRFNELNWGVGAQILKLLER
ncbi:hypothetical protein SRABI118_02407 [Massilia sp. Bi118]|uniref:hypothetical protein n=1 Tax=Massilia sp. Bi118 TaxID=2822346 RepID=UPI001DEF33D2|nr:hypothetical protein [Massilia sp. Bi118]CAH0228550.1 hypothetical protein SRABI118_02407 [Massilia sp. Bi118]